MERLRLLFKGQTEDGGDQLSEQKCLLTKPHEEGVYYTRDNLKNFNIKVVLRKVTASATQSGILRDTGRMSRASNTGDQDTEVWVFKWQEKVFSQHEDELYADANNCVTPLQSQYHRDILRLRSEGCRPNGRLFSYVDSDHLVPRNKETTKYRTFASKYSSSVRRRHVTKNKQGLPMSVIREPVLEHPSDDQRISRRINTPSSQSMFLMADLRKQDGVDPSDEHVLCQLMVDGHGRVTLSPDFTRDRPAIRIENRHREVFEYQLENVSDVISREEELKEQKVQCELYARHANYLKACVGDTFISPPEDNALRVHLHGEIVSAKGFEYDDIYVRAQLELPEGWQLEDGELSVHNLTVVSQISRTKSRHLYNVAYFGCPFEFQLLHSLAQDTGHLPKWPRLLLEVSSQDFWERHRVEGYGYLDIPSQPGSHELVVHTWRPAGNGLVDQLRRYFVGGAQQIGDLSYVACPRDFQGDRLSRYGFQTESSGSIKLHFNVLQQSSLFVADKQEQPTVLGDFRSTQATLDALWRAKKRAGILANGAK